jgi:outer membrane protein assembly factor BamB
MFYAIHLGSGRFLWAFAVGRAVHGGALTTDSAVFFAADDGRLYKLDRLTGKELWRYELGDAQVPRVLMHQVVENSGAFDWDLAGPTPVLVDSTLYIGSGDGSMHAVNPSTGARVWRSEHRGKIRGTAVIIGDRVVFGTFAGPVVALDRRTGERLWEKLASGPVVTSVGGVGDRVIVGSRYGVLQALDAATGAFAWRVQLWGSSAEGEPLAADGSLFYIGASDLRRVSLMDAKDGRVLWRTDVYGWAWPRPAISGQTLFVSTVGASPYQMRHLGALTALDKATGQVRWRWPAPEPAGSWGYGFFAPPVVAGRLVMVGGLDGSLYAFSVN